MSIGQSAAGCQGFAFVFLGEEEDFPHLSEIHG